MADPQRPKGIVLFLHGFGSSHKCWSRLLGLLQADDRLKPLYEFKTWDYPTRWVEGNALRRIPRLEEVARSLDAEIDSPEYRRRPVTLVGHSFGGLVIQSYIAELLKAGQAEKLRDIRQVILFATPNEGSTTAFGIRRFIYTLFSNPQEATLRVFHPGVDDLHRLIRERVVSAESDSTTARRIPFHAFCGLEDDIVPEASARGSFESVKCVKGDHFTILQPDDTSDPRYKEFVELLLEPGGHSHRFDVEVFEMTVKVTPCDKTVITTKTATPRTVEYDNVAKVRRSVRFTPSNRNVATYTLRYVTRNLGYVVGYTSHENKAGAAEIGQSEDTGTSFQFDFAPQPGEDFTLAVDVYKGFDAGHRDIHFHLGSLSHYRRLVFKLDLQDYVNGDFVLTRPPDLYLHPDDTGHGPMCNQRGARTPLAPSVSKPSGLYEWELIDLRESVVDLIWDVARKTSQSLPTSRDASGVTSAG